LSAARPIIPASAADSEATTPGSSSIPMLVKKIATKASRSGSTSAKTWCA
jgi:hypothetical protein